MSTLATWTGIWHSMPPLTVTDVHFESQKQCGCIQQFWSRGTHGCVKQQGLLAKDSYLHVDCSWMNSSKLVRVLALDPHRSTMSAAPLASRFSTMEMTDNFDEQGERLPSPPNAIQRHDASNGDNEDSVQFKGTGHPESLTQKRQFCKRCDKAALLCICQHVKRLVRNRTSIVILQHPEEKRHHLGTARIALLALEKVEMISVPEVDEHYSIRIREKVPGSKRFVAGRGGNKAKNEKENLKNKTLLPKRSEFQPVSSNPHPQLQPGSQYAHNPVREDGTIREEETATMSIEHQQLVQWKKAPPWISLQPDAGLLFPSEKALDLRPAKTGLPLSSDFERTSHCTVENLFINESGKEVPSNSPSQLIVLDGTWSKAKRIFFENPWLHSLPHYRLPTLQHSRYGKLRPEPKPGFLSTVESIVYALQLIEPETDGLGSLLDVFDAMIDDQVRLQEERGLSQDRG